MPWTRFGHEEDDFACVASARTIIAADSSLATQYLHRGLCLDLGLGLGWVVFGHAEGCDA
jgi:hypothetical protein